MKNVRLKYILVVSLICLGCDSELKIEPEQNISVEQALDSESDILALLIGTYAEAKEQATFGGRSQIISDLLGNTGQMNLNPSFPWLREIFFKNILVSNLFVQNHWANSYEVINQANLVLDHLNLITSSIELRSKVEGEARFLRALTYFDLVRLYGLQYEPGAINSQPGVPLRLSGITDYNNVDLSIARSSVEEVYNLIIADLTQATILLPESNDIYADRYGAKALLARVYLQQSAYNDGLVEANSVIENSGHGLALTFELVFNNDSDGSEDIYAFQVTDQDPIEVLGAIGPNALNEFYASAANGGRGGDLSVQEDYLNLFDDPINDDRYSFVYINPDNGRILTSKYTKEFGNITLVRLSEMYLIRAEANFRLGTSVGMNPLDDVNTIRSRSNASPLGSLDLDLILNERQLELGFEGHFIHDLRRNKSDVGILPYNDNSLLLPIPQAEMDTNPLMEQNPGY